MFGKLSTLEIEAVLRKNLVGRIGCCDKGYPYVVPISYAYDDEVVYCRSHEGMKLRIMRKNPSVCFEVEDYSDMANWRTVIARGEFEEIRDPVGREQALKHLSNRHLPIISSQTTHIATSWPFLPQNLNEIDGVVFRIKLSEITGRFERYEYVQTRD